MRIPSPYSWRKSAIETLRPSGERRSVGVRLDIHGGSMLWFRSKSYPGAEVIPAPEWRELFGDSEAAPDDRYHVVAGFPVENTEGSITIGGKEAEWTKLQELMVRAWINELCGSAGGNLTLLGSYADTLWPPPIWRRMLKQREKDVVKHFGYLVSVEQNRDLGRSHVIFITGRGMPQETEARQELWDRLIATANPVNRSERRKIGRSMMIEIERSHAVGTKEKRIFIGPYDESRLIWTPHYRWVVEQWFEEVFKPSGYELIVTGSNQPGSS